MADNNKVVVELGTVIKNRGEWDSLAQNAKLYKDNVVQYNGSAYIVKSAPASGIGKDILPTNTAYYEVFAGVGEVATGSDFDTPSAAQRGKITTVGAILDGMNDGVYNLTAKTGDSYATLNDALIAANNTIPTNKKRGGMSICFENSTGNKYVQSRYIGTSTATADFTNVANWQGVDDEPTAGSKNLVESRGVLKAISTLIAQNYGATVQEIQLSENTGEYIGSNGSVYQANNFAYTNYFHVEKGQVICLYAKGYSTNIGMISKLNPATSPKPYAPRIISIDSTLRTYIFYVEDSGDYALSYSTLEERIAYLINNCTEKLLDELSELRNILNEHSSRLSEDYANITELTNKSFGIEAQIVQVNEIQGKYISNRSEIQESAGFAYTEPFYAEEGQLITVYAKGYLTNIAIISKVITADQSYKCLVPSIDSEMHVYNYFVLESGYYAASFSINNDRQINLYSNTPKELSTKIKENTENISLIADIQDIPITVGESKKYIDHHGVVQSNNSFNYSNGVFLHKGDIISVKARGYLTYVSIISKVITEGSSYAPIVVSVDSTYRTYKYTADADGYYAFSWNNSFPIVVNRVKSNFSDNGFDISENLYFGIPIIGVIGDSLASGAGYNPNTGATSDNIQYAWWKVLERKSGMTYKRFCQGGMSTRSFITNSSYGLSVALTKGNECNVYIIGLGVNDRSSSSLGPTYLGSVSDIDLSNPDNNGDTYYGNYARIIQKITAFNNGCKFLLLTDPRTDGDFNDAIRTIANMFSNCYLIDLWELYSTYFISGGFFNKYKDQTGHYPAMAYQAMAMLIEKAINDCINGHFNDFKNIQYLLV